MLRSIALVVLLATPGLAAEPAGRMTTTTVFGDDACPTPTNGDIVVCGRLPESERFRIPKKLRENKQARTEQSWASRVETLDELARVQRPNSCSAVGLGGQTGCSEAMLRQWAAERRAEGKRAGIEF